MPGAWGYTAGLPRTVEGEGSPRREGHRMGLLLSSQPLLPHGLFYSRSTTVPASQRALKIEQSLLEDLPRMYAQTLLFSTFTNLAMGTIAPRCGKTSSRLLSHPRPLPRPQQCEKASWSKYGQPWQGASYSW
jgi:hypothetical protein